MSTGSLSGASARLAIVGVLEIAMAGVGIGVDAIDKIDIFWLSLS
jgi:hypothetical protein